MKTMIFAAAAALSLGVGAAYAVTAHWRSLRLLLGLTTRVFLRKARPPLLLAIPLRLFPGPTTQPGILPKARPPLFLPIPSRFPAQGRCRADGAAIAQNGDGSQGHVAAALNRPFIVLIT
jgi:hypothetical protein